MSTTNILPGCKRPLETIVAGSKSNTPASEAMITWSSDVTQ